MVLILKYRFYYYYLDKAQLIDQEITIIEKELVTLLDQEETAFCALQLHREAPGMVGREKESGSCGESLYPGFHGLKEARQR